MTLPLLGTPAAAALGVGAPSRPSIPAVVRTDISDLGRARATTPIDVAVTLAFRNEAELQHLVSLQGRPGNPLYHHFLTRAQFAAYFSPTVADNARVLASLRAAGFRIVRASPDRVVIDAEAPAAVAERYFATEIHTVAQAGSGVHYANVRPATIPADIAPVVRSVLGLDDLVRVHSDRVAALPDAPGDAAADVQPDASGPPLERIVNGTFAGLYPQGIKKAYKFPALTGNTGSGHQIGIVIDSDIANSDLAAFWKAAKVTRTGAINRVLVNGTNPGVNADVGETAIDTETTSSLAPAADIYIYLIKSLSDTNITDAYEQTISGGIVEVVSSSFGGCELGQAKAAQTWDDLAVEGATEGITFTASTGDQGGYCEYAAGKFDVDDVNAPASSPHFVAVGGTALTINAKTGARVTETAWSPGGANGGSGGGVSSIFGVPDYQAGLSGVAVVPNVTDTPYQPAVGFAGRNLPDISMDASNHPKSYIAVYVEGQWTGFGGTSVANPIYAAFVAEQNQMNGSYAGFLNESLYGNYAATGYGSLFKDVTSGSTGGGWSAVAGYDQSTGIGTVLDGESYSL